MDWETAYNAVRDATTTGGLVCLGFPRIVKEQFLGNISAARIACAEMQLRRPEVEEVYLQNCIAYRLNHTKKTSKESENMTTKEEEDHTIEAPAAGTVEKNEEEEPIDQKKVQRYYYRMNQKKIKRPKDVPWSGLIPWVEKNHPELMDDKYQKNVTTKKEAPMTPPLVASSYNNQGSCSRCANTRANTSANQRQRLQLQTRHRRRLRHLYPRPAAPDPQRHVVPRAGRNAAAERQRERRDPTHEGRDCDHAELRD